MTKSQADIRRQYRMLRVAAGKTQLDIIQEAGISANRYWRIEHGVIFPKPDERKAIAKALKVPAIQLPSEAAERVA